MAIATDELAAMRDQLIRLRARGVRVAQVSGERVEYADDASMARAIADLDAQIQSATPGGGGFKVSYPTTGRGL